MPLRSILLVEDSDMDRELCEIIIQQFDPQIELQIAEDGNIALDKLLLSSSKPDIILLDINMPNLDGFGFLDRYKLRHTPPTDPPVYVMIASAEQRGDIRKAGTYDCVKGCVLKPLSLESMERISRRSPTTIS